MFQEVVLVTRRPNEEPYYEIVRARPVGRVYTWCDPTTPGAGGIFFLLEGEDGRWFIQQINHFPKFGFFAIHFPFLSLDDAKCTFPDELTYVLS
jgi:hypothetical protein